jgi:hypothetical protein
MRQGDLAVTQERLATAVALLEEARGRDHRRLHLGIAIAFALVEQNVTAAAALQASQLVVLLCGMEGNVRKHLKKSFRGFRTFQQMDFRLERLTILVAFAGHLAVGRTNDCQSEYHKKSKFIHDS